MNVVVFGGSGFVGVNLCEALLAEGHKVTVFDRSPLPPLEGRAGLLTFIQGDITDRHAAGAAVADGIDVAILGAAITAGTARDAAEPEQTLSVNLMAQVPILEAARRAGVRRIINLSSAAAYGASGTRFPQLDETTPCDPGGLYAITKFASEKVGARLCDLWGLDFVSVRLSGVFGPWERSTGVRDTLSPQAQILSAAEAGEAALLERPGMRDWVYAPDVAAAVALLVRSPSLRHRLYNISFPARWSVLDWGRALAGLRPGFTCRLVEPGEKPTIDLHASVDRAPLSTARLTEEFGWTAGTGCIDSVRMMDAWMRRHRAAMEVS